MELTKEQIEKRDYYNIRLKGRHAIITNPYWTKLDKDTKIQIMSYIEDKGMFKVLAYDHGDYTYCLADEFVLIDKEFSDFKIIKKGIRAERKDKFGDRFMLELQNNKRDIYLSSSLVSLLNLNDAENYVGFATDPDTGRMYIFSADNASGYLLNKDNNRITSVADWREMFKLYETMNFEITPQPIIDNNNPGFIFYTVNANYNYFGKTEQPVNQHKGNTQKSKVNNIGIEGTNYQPFYQSEYSDIDVSASVKTVPNYYAKSNQETLQEKLRNLQKIQKIELIEQKQKKQF